jgi:NAD(P)-dependent dehydrogenase (short-subunit alcohol dehydrogenase family)
MFEPGLLSGKKILITGGGTGLGAAMADRFAELGAHMVICGRRLEPLHRTAAALEDRHGARVDAFSCDIRVAAAVDEMLDAIWATGPLDGLINNAGALVIAQTEHLSPRAVDSVLAPNLNGSIYCTLGVGRRWIEARQRGGVVLSILSTSTVTGRAFSVPTSIAKAGVLAMTRSLAVEWASRGIRLVAIAPGRFATEGFLNRLGEGRAALESSAPTNSLERPGQPPELANLAVYLISDQASYVNGEMVAIDGGRHLRNSGVEDLLARSEADWDELRRARRT